MASVRQQGEAATASLRQVVERQKVEANHAMSALEERVRAGTHTCRVWLVYFVVFAVMGLLSFARGACGCLLVCVFA